MTVDRVSLQRGVRFAVEYRRRHRPIELPELFPEQAEYIACQDRLKGLICPRRAGMTVTFSTELWVDAQRYPGRQQLYLGLTLPHATRVLYAEQLGPALDARQIRHSFAKNDGLVRFGNGSSIQIMGLDASPKLLEQVLGGRPHRVIVDEAQSQTQDLEKLCWSKVWPALQDYLPFGGGWLEMGGTPGERMGTHYWWRVTKTDAYGNQDPTRLGGWKVFSWPMSANPHMRAQFETEERRREAEAAGRYDWRQATDWRREWLGQWVLDESSLVYRFEDRPASLGGNVLDDAELVRSLLEPRAEWSFVMGIDLGFEDPSALVLGAWRPADPRFYIVKSFAQTHMGYSDVGRMARAWADRYPLLRVLVDVSSGAAKQIAESLKQDYQLPAEDADKREKGNHVSRMNADFVAGKIAIIPDGNRELMQEYQQHAVDPKSKIDGVWAEPKRHNNHRADGALYAWRASLHRHARPAPVVVEPTRLDIIRARRERDTQSLTRVPEPSPLSPREWG